MKQFTIVYLSKLGRRFKFIDAIDKDDAKLQIYQLDESATILSVRENNPPLETIEAR